MRGEENFSCILGKLASVEQCQPASQPASKLPASRGDFLGKCGTASSRPLAWATEYVQSRGARIRIEQTASFDCPTGPFFSFAPILADYHMMKLLALFENFITLNNILKNKKLNIYFYFFSILNSPITNLHIYSPSPELARADERERAPRKKKRAGELEARGARSEEERESYYS